MSAVPTMCNTVWDVTDTLQVTKMKKNIISGTSLVVQWLRLCAPNAGGMGSIPGLGTKIPHAVWCSQKKEKKIFLNITFLRS